MRRVRAAVPDADVLVLDDNSPDGTGEVADELAAADPQVHVLHRAGKQGLGAAYLAGFGWALDARLRRRGRDGRRRLAPARAAARAARRRSSDADLVIGSRWVRGGAVVNWPLHRKVLSVGGNLYTRVLLGMPVHDATGGLPRLPRRRPARRMGLDDVASQGYCFQVDLTWRAVRPG